jgi:hypothetical protein
MRSLEKRIIIFYCKQIKKKKKKKKKKNEQSQCQNE